MSANPTAGTRESTQTINPLKALADFGQSVWLDYIRRNLMTTGELARLIHEDGLRGMTSNPAIFEKAIAGSTDYSKTLEELAKRKDLDAKGIYEQLAIRDIQDAADALRRRLRSIRSAAMATSASKFLPISRTRRRRRSTKPCACGRRSIAPT